MTDTSADYIRRVLNAAPFADNEAGIPEMCELIAALAAERDALRAEQAEAREAGLREALDQVPMHWCSGENIRDRINALIQETPNE